MKKGCLAALLYLLLAAFTASNGLFTSKVGLSADSLYRILPWSGMRTVPDDQYNPALAHEAFSIYPWMQYSLDHLREGKIPLWSSLAGGGTPFMGNLSCACFFPLNWLALLVPFSIFWSLAGMVKLWLGAFLTYALLRKYRVGFVAALFGGMAFGFGGFQICWLNHPNSNVAFFLPALFLAAEYFIKRRGGFALVLNSLLLGLQILGGSPETSCLLYISWSLYLLYRIRQEVDLFSSEGLRLVFYGGLCAMLGVALVAFQIWPFFEYLGRSYSMELRIRYWDSYLNGGPGRFFTFAGFILAMLFPVLMGAAVGLLQRKDTIFIGFWSGLLGGLCLIVALRIGFWLGTKPHVLMQVLPELYGPATGGCTTVGDISFSALNGGYVGVLTAFLALYTLVAPCKRRPIPFFVFLLVCSFGAAHSIPWLTPLVKSIPFLGWIQNSLLLSLTAFSIAVIAPIGLEDLIYRAANIRGRSAAIVGVIAAVLVLSCAVLSSGWTFFQTGFDLVKPEKEANPRVVIIEPMEGDIADGVGPLKVEGLANMEVKQVKARLDRIELGERRTNIEAGTGEGGRRFEFTYDMSTVDEGAYTIKIDPVLPSRDVEERELPGGDWRNIRVVRPKVVTQKDLLVILFSCLGFLLLMSRGVPIPLRTGAAVIILTVDLCIFGLGFSKTSDPEEFFPSTKITDFLVEEGRKSMEEGNGPFRIFAEGGILHPNSNFPFGIEHMEWDDRLGLSGYCKVCNHIKLDHIAKPSQLFVSNCRLDHPLIDLMGVKYILVKTDFDLGRLEKFERVFTNGPIRIYENLQARNRAFISGQWINREITPIEEVVKADLRNVVVLERDPGLHPGGTGSVKVLEYTSDRVRLEVRSEGEALLVLADNYFPGWEVRVDDQEGEILEATAAFRAVPLKRDGVQTVTFIYSPASFYQGIYLAMAALAVCLLLVIWPRLTTPMRRKIEEASLMVENH